MSMGVHSDYCVSLRAPVLVLLITVDIYVELVHEGLGIILVLDGYQSIIEVLSQVQLLVDIGSASFA